MVAIRSVHGVKWLHEMVDQTRVKLFRIGMWVAGGVIACSLQSGLLPAQMIQTSTPFNTVTESFNQRMGVDFGFQLQGGQGSGSRTVGLLPGGVLSPNIAFRQGGVTSAVPQFGGFDPNSQATFGFANVSGGNQFGLGLVLGQGSNRTMTSTVPTVVMENGATASVFSGQIRPFVTGYIPVVGNHPRIHNMYVPRQNHLRELLNNAPPYSSGYSDLELNGSRRDEFDRSSSGSGSSLPHVSSAATGARSVQAIKAEREMRLAQELETRKAKIIEFIERANKFEDDGKKSLALSYYRSALQTMQSDLEFDALRTEVAEQYERLLAELKDRGSKRQK